MKNESTPGPRTLDRRSFNQLLASLGICAAIEPGVLSADSLQTSNASNDAKDMPPVTFDKLVIGSKGGHSISIPASFITSVCPKKIGGGGWICFAKRAAIALRLTFRGC